MAHDEKVAICFAVIYSLSSYRFVNVFYRAALGESIAMAFLPIILLGTYYIFFKDHNKWETLAFGFALICYSHLISVLLSGAIVILLLVASFYWWDHKRERVAAFVKSIVASIGLSCGTLIPMVQASVRNNVWHPEGTYANMMKHTREMSEILANSISNSPTYYSIGLITLIALVGALILMIRESTKGEVESEETGKLSALYLAVGALLVIAPSTLFPWALIARTPALIIQFPWRVNAYSTLFIAAAFAFTLFFVKERTRKMITIVICVAAVLFTWSAVFVLHVDEYERITEESIEKMEFETNDYVPTDAKTYKDEHQSTMDKYYCDGKEIVPEVSVSSNGGKVFVVVENARANQVLDIPVFWFSTIKTKVDGKDVSPVMSDRGTVKVTIPSDGKTTIEVYHIYTRLTYLSWAFSFVILLFTLFSSHKLCFRRSIEVKSANKSQ